MKIGLLRHFKTDHHFPRRCNSDTYNSEYWRYEKSSILPVPPENIPDTSDYDICFASTAPRAIETAEQVFRFPDEIVTTPELIEVPLQTLFRSRFRLSMKFWHLINRMAWGFNSKKMPETRAQTKKRARQIISKLLMNPLMDKEKNILLVTHGFFMVALQSELKRRGFKGQEFIRPEHGTLYQFEKTKETFTPTKSKKKIKN